MCGVFVRVSKEVAEQVQNGKINELDLLNMDSGYVEDDCLLDIDKLWDVVNFVLAGNACETANDPLSKVVYQGALILVMKMLQYFLRHLQILVKLIKQSQLFLKSLFMKDFLFQK